MTTSEKIAEVVSRFIALDREEDFAASLEKCAALVVENKRLAEYASGNWVDVPPPSDAGCLYPECGPTCRRDCPPASVVETPAVKMKRTPKVGDRVRAKMSGRTGVVHKLFGGVALINQGGLMFEVLASEIEVIE